MRPDIYEAEAKGFQTKAETKLLQTKTETKAAANWPRDRHQALNLTSLSARL